MKPEELPCMSVFFGLLLRFSLDFFVRISYNIKLSELQALGVCVGLFGALGKFAL